MDGGRAKRSANVTATFQAAIGAAFVRPTATAIGNLEACRRLKVRMLSGQFFDDDRDPHAASLSEAEGARVELADLSATRLATGLLRPWRPFLPCNLTAGA